MSNIVSSASKIVFILLALTACVAFLFLVVMGRVTLESKDFMLLAGMAFAFYFSNKGETSAPFAGK